MDYTGYSHEQLLNRIEYLEMLTDELLKEKEQETKLEYAWTGNLGHWYWHIKTNEVTFNPLKVTALGYEEREIPEHVTYQFFTERLHAEDYQKTMNAMLEHLQGRAEVYEAEYRIRTKEGGYKWYYDRGRITRYDKSGKPSFLAGIVFDITEKKEIQLELEQKNSLLSELSSIDGLTKISNHRTLIERLNAETADAMRTGKPLSVVIFDIDDFKRINDTRGHVCGDRVLAETASVIKQSIRDADLAGRYGGEEFMVILADADIGTALKIAERARKAIEEKIFEDGVTVTVSGGAAQYRGEDLPEFIQRADRSLYEAKRGGKNQIKS